MNKWQQTEFSIPNQDVETDGRRNNLVESLLIALSIFVWFPLLPDRVSASTEKK